MLSRRTRVKFAVTFILAMILCLGISLWLSGWLTAWSRGAFAAGIEEIHVYFGLAILFLFLSGYAVVFAVSYFLITYRLSRRVRVATHTALFVLAYVYFIVASGAYFSRMEFTLLGFGVISVFVSDYIAESFVAGVGRSNRGSGSWSAVSTSGMSRNGSPGMTPGTWSYRVRGVNDAGAGPAGRAGGVVT